MMRNLNQRTCIVPTIFAVEVVVSDEGRAGDAPRDVFMPSPNGKFRARLSSFCRHQQHHDTVATTATPSPLISPGLANLVRYVRHPLKSFTPPIGPPQQRADPQDQIAHHERPLPPPLREGRFPRARCCPPIGHGTPCPRRQPDQEGRSRTTADGERRRTSRAEEEG